MTRSLGLILASTETGIVRAVLEDGCVVVQTLAVTNRVPLTPAQLADVQQWVQERTYTDPVLETLAELERSTCREMPQP